jgi:hypothetical protein
MAANREMLHELIESLPETEIATAQQFLLSLSRESIGPQFAESIRKGIAQADAGKTTVCHSYDDMVEKLLDKE